MFFNTYEDSPSPYRFFYGALYTLPNKGPYTMSNQTSSNQVSSTANTATSAQQSIQGQGIMDNNILGTIISTEDSISVNYNSEETDVKYINLYSVGGHVKQDKGTNTKLNFGEYILTNKKGEKTRKALSSLFIQGSKKATLGHKCFMKGLPKAIHTVLEDGSVSTSTIQKPKDQEGGINFKFQLTQTKALDLISLVEKASGTSIFDESGEVDISEDWAEMLSPDDLTGVNLCRLGWQLVIKVTRKCAYYITSDSEGKGWDTFDHNNWNILGLMLVAPGHPMYYYGDSNTEDFEEVLGLLGWLKKGNSVQGSTTEERVNAIRNKAGLRLVVPAGSQAFSGPAAVSSIPCPSDLTEAQKMALAVAGKPVPALKIEAPVIKWVAPSGKKDIMKSNFYGDLVAQVAKLAGWVISVNTPEWKQAKDDVWNLGANGTSANTITSFLKTAELKGVAPSNSEVASLAAELTMNIEASYVTPAPAVVTPVATPIVEAIAEEEDDAPELVAVAYEEIDLDDLQPSPSQEAEIEADLLAEADPIPNTITLATAYGDDEDEDEEAETFTSIPTQIAASASSAVAGLFNIDPAAIAAAMSAYEFSATISADDSDEDDEI